MINQKEYVHCSKYYTQFEGKTIYHTTNSDDLNMVAFNLIYIHNIIII